MTIDPGQLGKDYITLRRVLDKYGYQNSFLVGPDISQPVFDKIDQVSTKFLERYIKLVCFYVESPTFFLIPFTMSI